MATNQGFKAFVCGPELSQIYLYYKLLTMKPVLLEKSYGSTFLEISTANVVALQVLAPPLPEQHVIATVLADLDDEIDALQARRDKTHAIKQGMMAELLTGRTRLV